MRAFTGRTPTGHRVVVGSLFTVAVLTTSRPARRRGLLVLIVTAALGLTACVPQPGGSPERDAATPTSATSEALPAPGRTIEASPSAAPDLRGYRIAVVVADESAPSRALLAGAREFAASSGAELVEFPAAVEGDDPVGEALAGAVDSSADVVVGLGDGVVGVFDFETGKILDQQVLVIGGQLAEPTENVTAVIWPGATSREATVDDSVTVQRGIDALTAGLTSIRDGVSGVVLSLD